MINDINVANGKYKVGIYTDAKRGAFIKAVDFSLIIQ